MEGGARTINVLAERPMCPVPSFADVLLMARTVSVKFNIRQQQIRKTQIKIQTPQQFNSQTFCQVVMMSNRDFELIVLKNINFISRMIQI